MRSNASDRGLYNVSPRNGKHLWCHWSPPNKQAPHRTNPKMEKSFQTPFEFSPMLSWNIYGELFLCFKRCVWQTQTNTNNFIFSLLFTRKTDKTKFSTVSVCRFLLKKPLDPQILVCLLSCQFTWMSAECIPLLKVRFFVLTIFVSEEPSDVLALYRHEAQYKNGTKMTPNPKNFLWIFMEPSIFLFLMAF